VVVEAGRTEMLVPVTVPTVGPMETDVAPVTLQESVDAPPAVMAAGAAVKEEMSGAATDWTAVAQPCSVVAEMGETFPARSTALT
jgi:hypothetical protein